jgi:homoserine kinase
MMKKYKSVTAFGPATVANVGCGYDIMGFAIHGMGDEVTVSLGEGHTFSPVGLSGPYGHLIPNAREKNTASVAISCFLHAIGQSDLNLIISLVKNMPLGSGMGSSASSSAAAVFAANELLGRPLSAMELIPFAMEGERIACGAAHADNVAPSILGGFVLIRSYSPILDIIEVQCPEDLYCAVVHPHLELHTADARRVLKMEITMSNAIRHSANTAGFMVALMKGDYALLSRSMHDLLAEPRRTQLIPGFDSIKKNALKSGAMGCGISGSGPSLFALCKGESTAENVAHSIQQGFTEHGLESDVFVSALNAPGCAIINSIGL